MSRPLLGALVNEMVAGSSFGEQSILSGKDRDASIVTNSEGHCKLFSLDAAAFRRLGLDEHTRAQQLKKTVFLKRMPIFR